MTDQRIKQGVWRYNPTIIENEAGEPIAAMVKSTNGRYVEHSELFVSAISKERCARYEAALHRIAITDDADCVHANDPKAMTCIAREALKP
jgi:pSer/pThr/pTyr-binding forkhead associated (FHA) protein